MLLSSKSSRAEAFQAMGGKAYALAKMKQSGFPVPDFICVTAEETMENIFSALRETCGQAPYFAVRSSAGGEDGEDFSFAGQFETFLNVPVEEIPSKVAACFASMHSQSVKAYTETTGSAANGMSVIIQQMIPAELSGVLFTENPLGIKSEMVLVVGKGYGSGVVSDSVPTTAYYHNRPDGLGYFVRQADAPLLEDKLKAEIVGLGIKLEKVFPRGLDIEFSVSGQKVWLLQARPITAKRTGKAVILDNSNIVESYPGITKPLTMSFIRRVYADIFQGLIRRLSGGGRLIEAYPDVFSELVESYNGRVFYRIDNWYKVIGFLPFSKKIIPVWQEMMGVEEKEETSPAPEASFFLKARIALTTAKLFVTVPRYMERLEQEFQKIAQKFRQSLKPGMSRQELQKLYLEMQRTVLQKWDITLANDMYAFLYTAMLKKALRQKGYQDAKINEQIAGISNLESMKPVLDLAGLALEYRRGGRTALFDERFQSYLERFGDRSIGELKLETDTFREQPELLFKQVKAYAQREDLEHLLERLQEGREKMEGGFIIRFLTRRAAQGIGWRESSRMNRTRLFGFARRIFLEAGERLTEAGFLCAPQDVFYLTLEEVFAPEQELCTLCEKVEQRKAEFLFYETLPAYRRVVFTSKVVNKPVEAASRQAYCESGGSIRGTPASSGKARGEILRVLNPDECACPDGKILVTVSTDPGWVFLLARAKGVISEKGSLLSHTAIVARELSIPAIVGVPGALERFADGDLVELDCESGEIVILKRAQEQN